MPTTKQLQTAITMRAQDKSYGAISEATGIPLTTTFRTLQKDEISQLIKQAQTTIIKNALETAVNNQVSKIQAGTQIIDKIVKGEKLNTGAVKLAELAHDSEKQLLQSVGIHNAHTQSIQVNNILVDNRSELSPVVERLLMQHMTSAIDAEYSVQDAVNSVPNEGKTG